MLDQHIFYISPSIVPSRFANAIHVINMCQGLVQLGHKVTLCIATSLVDDKDVQKTLRKYYGVDLSNVIFTLVKIKHRRGVELVIAITAFFSYMKLLFLKRTPNIIISRNLYGAFLLGVIMNRSVIYETHSPEYGVRKILQKRVLLSRNIQTVVISKALRNIITDTYDVYDDCIHVFHDAARSGYRFVDKLGRSKIQSNLLGDMIDLSKCNKVIGYFGHLYHGRGIEIIEGVAKENPHHIFLVYGGNQEEISFFQKHNFSNNLFFMGHVPPSDVNKWMSTMDVLLMPYQESVSIGLDGVDTSKWMSPMKMFEYMSAGVPIISSDLPVIKEVLVHGQNSLLVKPNSIEEWSNAIQQLVDLPELEEMLGKNAYSDYKIYYTWKIRAEKMLALEFKEYL